MQKPFKKVGTHHGRFHADEVMATAILKEIFEIQLIRTRDQEVLDTLDIVYDVGGGEFDHHGIDKVYREDGIPFAASGLIWRRFGRDVIRFICPMLDEDEIQYSFNRVDSLLIKGIDALDNGVRINNKSISVMNIASIISGFNPPWYSEKSEEKAFDEAVNIASIILKNTIEHSFSVLKSKEIISKAYKDRYAAEILALDTYCAWEEALELVDKKQEVVFVIYPDKENYALQAVRGKGGKEKKLLPESWAGKTEKELAAVTGVRGAVFCHTERFIAVAKTLKGVTKMAELAINHSEQ
ncbi:MYG1 family protein [Geosporobacter ferrireducens]|nr:MYG1 family protein [Geosporobacter ferrireducens]MTI56003.1 MYG1 family protein [Geosporobacter ferrireducens]